MTDLQENVIEFNSIPIPKTFSNEIIQQFYQVHQLTYQQIKRLQTYCEMIKSENTLEMYEGLVGLRTILSDQEEKVEQIQLILQVICELNTLKYIIHIIEHNQLQLILYEAIQILKQFILGSTLTSCQIIENGAIKCLVQKFSSGKYHDDLIQFLCVFLSCFLYKYGKQMIQLGTLKILNNYAMEKISKFENLNIISCLTWSIKIYFEFSSKLPSQDIQVSLRIFKKWIQQDFPEEILFNICVSIYLFIKQLNHQIQVIIDLEIIPRMIELLEFEDAQLFAINIQILNKILKSHQNHQQYLYELGIIPCLGRLINKYRQCRNEKELFNLIKILKTFKIISLSKYLSQFLLKSNELDQLLSLNNLNHFIFSVQVHDIIENLIESQQDVDNLNLKEKKKFIKLCKIFASGDKIKEKKELCERILNLCDTYLNQERNSLYHKDLEELKKKITQKLK